MRSSRRTFLGAAAGLAAPAAGRVGALVPLPMVPFGKHKISRLIIGCNQFYGYSHFNNLLSTIMKDWYTPERVCETLRRCEQNGITVWQTGAGGRAATDLAQYKAQGGTIQVIALGKDGVEEAVHTMRPIGLAHHGEVTDVAFREGRMAEVHEFVKRVRQTGVLAGVSTHKPEVVEYVEEKGWDLDFFMTCAYNRTRTAAEFRKLLGGELPTPANEVYLQEDPERMYTTIRKTSKTCLAFKILAAGRVTNSAEQLDKAFHLALENIKPTDGVIVGMFPFIKDEIQENAERVRRITAALT